MKRITNNTAAMVALIGTLSFFIWAPLFGASMSIEIAANIAAAVMFGIMVKWAIPAIIAVKVGGKTGPNFLAMAIFGWGAAGFFHRVWVNVVRWMEWQSWSRESYITAFAIWTLAVSGAMVILAPGTERGVVPRSNQLWLLGCVAFGSAMAGFMLGVSFATGT